MNAAAADARQSDGIVPLHLSAQNGHSALAEAPDDKEGSSSMPAKGSASSSSAGSSSSASASGSPREMASATLATAASQAVEFRMSPAIPRASE